MMNYQSFFVFFALLLMSSCAHMFEGRTFIGEMERESDGVFVAGRDFKVVAGDSGQSYRSREEIMMRTPASYRSKDEYLEQRSLMNELRQREAALTPMERRDYDRVYGHLETESERIYYLTLSPNERSTYMQARLEGGLARGRSIASTSSNDFFHVMSNAPTSDIVLGMDKGSVGQIWGQPLRVDVAGNPRHQNERWAYREGRQWRYVYFEGGVVSGWSFE